jgi:hypothetical protein
VTVWPPMPQSPLATSSTTPSELAHVLALDRDHRVGETLDDLALLRGRVDALDDLDLDEWHAGSPCRAGGAVVAMVRPGGAPHIGHIP